MITHWIWITIVQSPEIDFNIFIVESLNQYVEKFKKYPNVIYLRTKSRRSKKLKGPEIRFSHDSKIPTGGIAIGHTSDTGVKLKIGSLESYEHEWSYEYT